MKFLRNIYFSQYYELKKKGKEEKAFLNGNVLVATLFAFVAACLFFIEMIFFPKSHALGDLLVEFIPSASGKFNGQILGAILLSVLFIIVRFTIGTRKNFEKNIAYFNQLTLPKQRKLVRKGNALFMGVCFVMIVLMFTGVLSL